MLRAPYKNSFQALHYALTQRARPDIKSASKFSSVQDCISRTHRRGRKFTRGGGTQRRRPYAKTRSFLENNLGKVIPANPCVARKVVSAPLVKSVALRPCSYSHDGGS